MKIHIVGICGIGMSAIAQILHGMGYDVQGSDLMAEGENFQKLISMGIRVMDNHSRENISAVDLIIKSTAIKENNIEIVAAKTLNKKIFTRAQALKMLLENKRVVSISGAHGKSTSTAIVYSILEKASLNPSLVCGAIVNSIINNAKLGKSDIFILEADESDASFSKIPYLVGGLTNIDFEHIDYYGSFEGLINSYRSFIQNVHNNGMVAICRDDERLFNIADSMYDKSSIVYYGIDNHADIRAVNIKFDNLTSSFDVEFSGKLINLKPIRGVAFNMLGKHNIYNALLAISIATRFKVSAEIIKYSLANFMGLNRRFTILGKVNGALVVDDYAHHPTEIKSNIEAVKNLGRIICIIQPHRFSRVKNLFDEYIALFDKVFFAFLLDVYSAGEPFIEQCDSQSIVDAAKAKGIDNIDLISNPDEMCSKILPKIVPGDFVIFFGAGDVSKFAKNFFANANTV